MPTANGRVLDRVPEQDLRSLNYPVRSLIRPEAAQRLRSYTWKCSVYLDQGQEGACVGHGIAHEYAADPSPHTPTEQDALNVYNQAKKIDEYPGEDYSGTSTTAGMKVAVSMGWYGEYRWAFTTEDVVLSLGFKGPVVIGVNWYADMFEPDANGFLHATGNLSGGHCTLLRGVSLAWTKGSTGRTFADLDLDKSYVLIHNSWGQDWGMKGTAKLSLRDFDRLLKEQGDACVPVVRK